MGRSPFVICTLCIFAHDGGNAMRQNQYTPASELQHRIQALQQALDKEGLDGALIFHHINLFYYSGTSQSAHLFVPRAGEPLLLARKSFERARRESALAEVIESPGLKDIPALLRERGYTLRKVGLELDITPWNTVQFYAKNFAGSTFADISKQMKRIRMIKSDYEIALLLAAAEAHTAVFAEVPGMLREGMTELELAGLYEAAMRRRGFSGGCRMRAFNQSLFLGNVNSGTSGAVPTFFDGPVGGAGATAASQPHGASWKTIGRGEPIYIDYTCIIDGYTVDQTRMFCIGKMPEKMRAAYEAALGIQDAVLARIRPGVPWDEVYLHAVELAEQHGLADCFMGLGKDRVRFAGHGVGLELDEFPVFAPGLKMPLEKGMVFALEPTFVFPEGAVGIENTHVVTENGVRTLTGAAQEIICVP